MNVKFYTFAKRPNSTKQPASNSEILTLSDVELKDECSFLNPVLRIKDRVSGTAFVPGNYNYAYISLWLRYYFVNDWKYVNGAWEVTLSVDPLASFKTAIGNTQAYIVRSASHYNGNIIDTFYPTTTVKNISKQSISSEIYHTTIPAGCYIVGILNNASSNLNVGAINYYALTATQFSSFLQYIFSGAIYNSSNIVEVGEGLFKSMFDPFQYVISCMWFPFDVAGFGTTTENIKVGYWDTGISGRRLQYLVAEHNFKSDSPISAHPLASTRGNYLNYAPYTTLTLYYPPFGEIPIDTTFNQYMPNTYLWGKLYIDAITGCADCYVTLTNGNNSSAGADPYRYMTMRSAQVGVPIQLAQVMTDTIGRLIGAGVSAVDQLLGIKPSGIFDTILSGIQSSLAKTSVTGSNGSFIEIVEPPYLVCEYASLIGENNEEFGRPLCDKRFINTLSGFVKCGEDDHEFACTDYERNTINQHLKNGFFYE